MAEQRLIKQFHASWRKRAHPGWLAMVLVARLVVYASAAALADPPPAGLPPPAAPAPIVAPVAPTPPPPGRPPAVEVEPEPAPSEPTPAPPPVVSAPLPSVPPPAGGNELDLFKVLDAVRLQVPIVVTASRQEESATEAPATTIVVTREEIRQRGYSFLKDVLRDLPGMETQEYHFSEWGTQVPVRGVIGNNKLIVLINGMRVNPPGGEAMMLRSDISVRDAEQIEIVYGPGSTLYGQDAISAVINVITTKPEEDNVHLTKAAALRRLLEPSPPGPRLASVGVELGYPWQKEVYGTLNLRLGEARFYGSVHYLEKQLTDLSQAYPEVWSLYQAQGQGRGLALDPNRYDTGLNAMFRAEYGKTSVQLWYRQSARNSSEGYGLPPTLGYVNEARWSDASVVAEARNTLPIGRFFSLESVLTFNRYAVQPDTRYVFLGAAPSPGQPAPWDLADFKYAEGTSGAVEERLLFRLQQRLTVVAGLTGIFYDVTPKSSIPGGVDLNSSIPQQGGSLTYYTTQGDASSVVNLPRVNVLTYQDFGGYVEVNWKIFRLLRLIAGIRIDKNTRVSDLAVSPRAALIFNYKGFTAKYIFSRAFVSPPPYFEYNVFYNGNSINAANPNLTPETALSNELNLGFNNKYVSVGASVYYNTQANLLIQGDAGLPISIVQTVWLDPQGTQSVVLTHSANAGGSTAVGTDLYGKFSAWRLSGWASYSYTNFTQTLEGKVTPMQGLSAHNFRLGITGKILKNLHATVSAIVRSVPENLKVPPILTGLIEIPWELNAHVVYSPIPAIDLYADFRNLTNHTYYLAAQDYTPYPVQAFQGSGGLRFRF